MKVTSRKALEIHLSRLPFYLRDGDPVLIFRNGGFMEITPAAKQLKEFEETMGGDDD